MNVLSVSRLVNFSLTLDLFSSKWMHSSGVVISECGCRLCVFISLGCSPVNGPGTWVSTFNHFERARPG